MPKKPIKPIKKPPKVATKKATVNRKAKSRAVSTFINWRKPSFAKAQAGIENAQQSLKLDPKKFATAVKRAQKKDLIELSDKDWAKLQNSDSSNVTSMKDVAKLAKGQDYKSIEKALINHTRMAAPLVLFQKGKKPVLISGDTSLMVSKALGVRPRVQPVELKEDISETATLKKKKAKDPFYGVAGQREFNKHLVVGLDQLSRSRTYKKKVATSISTIIGQKKAALTPVENMMLSDERVNLQTLKRKASRVRKNQRPRTIGEFFGLLTAKLFYSAKDLEHDVERKFGFRPDSLSELLGFKTGRALYALKERKKVPNPIEAPDERRVDLDAKDLLKGRRPKTPPTYDEFADQFGGTSGVQSVLSDLTSLAEGAAVSAVVLNAKSALKWFVSALGRYGVKGARAAANAFKAPTTGAAAVAGSELMIGMAGAAAISLNAVEPDMDKLADRLKKYTEEQAAKHALTDTDRKRAIAALEDKLRKIDEQIGIAQLKGISGRALAPLQLQRQNIIQQLVKLGQPASKYLESTFEPLAKGGPKNRYHIKKYEILNARKMLANLGGSPTDIIDKPTKPPGKASRYKPDGALADKSYAKAIMKALRGAAGMPDHGMYQPDDINPTAEALGTFKNRIGAVLNPSYGSYLSVQQPAKELSGGRGYTGSAGGYGGGYDVETKKRTASGGGYTDTNYNADVVKSPAVTSPIAAPQHTELLGKGVVKQGAQGGALGPSLQPGQIPTYSTGKFRPTYKLGKADLSDAVINTIAGEARNNKTSIDGVINNMFNRVGVQKNWGNLQEVARAPGQYTGYRKASPEQAAFIRSRIEAIASGNEPDITNGATEYRATSYVRGSGAGKTFARQAQAQGNRDIGGNTFAQTFKPGPYAAYPKVKDETEQVASIDWTKGKETAAPKVTASRNDRAPANQVADASGTVVPAQPQKFNPDNSVLKDKKYSKSVLKAIAGAAGMPDQAPITPKFDADSVKGHPTPSISQDTEAVIKSAVRAEIDKTKQEIRDQAPAVAKPQTPQKVPSASDTPQVHTQHMQPPASYVKSTQKAKNQPVPAASNSQALTEPSFWTGWQ